MIKSEKGTVLKGALLIAGTTIGGGILALPVLTSLGGFFPSICLFFVCWLFMLATAFLFLELGLQMPPNANILTMATLTLGNFGKIITWGLYLFLFYCLTVAYTVGCGDLVNDLLPASFSRSFGPIIFILSFAPFIYLGPKVVGKFNLFLMLGLACSYFLFIILGFKEISIAHLKFQNWSYSFIALPVAFTSFAYQGIIPTLITYLDRDLSKIKKSIFLGSLIPLVAYILWQGLILGILPVYGANSLHEALLMGKTAVYPLKNQLANPFVYTLGQFFAFFALLTSFFWRYFRFI